MIQEVKIDFRGSSEQVIIHQKKSYQEIQGIMSDLNQCSEKYCIVLKVIEASSLPDYNPIHIRLQSLMGSLTKREFEIYDLAMKGFTNKEIAQKLFISLETVRSHRKSIVSKAAVSKMEDIKDWLLEANTILHM
jgi:DNA-binding CsgD family transcriptional regulator